MAGPSGIALLLSRIGARVSADFADRVELLGLTPPQVAVLRVVGQRPGITQQALAESLGIVPSRVTKLVDELEEQRLLVRERSTTDRRTVELRVVEAAQQRLVDLRRTVTAHDAAVVGALTDDERATLLALLNQVADHLGLSAAGHDAGPRRPR